jgi:hypothetical protein
VLRFLKTTFLLGGAFGLLMGLFFGLLLGPFFTFAFGVALPAGLIIGLLIVGLPAGLLFGLGMAVFTEWQGDWLRPGQPVATFWTSWRSRRW